MIQNSITNLSGEEMELADFFFVLANQIKEKMV
jgi:hypothetical protein